MAWKIEADVGEFDSAVSAFRRRMPITREVADKTNDFSHARGFTLAGVAQLQVVQHVHDSLVAAIQKGTPFEEWKKTVEPSLTAAWGRKDAPRIETIFRNATMQAYNAGRREQMLAPDVLKYRPYWMFDGIADARQSPICQACNGVILPWDDAWWATHTPQLHHRCRSSIRNLRRADAEKRGITANPPTIAADKGFGVPADRKPPWKPDVTKIPPKLVDTYQKKVAKLEAAPEKATVKATAPLQAKAKQFREALELRDGGKAARTLLREQVQATFPGAVPRNGGHFADFLVIGHGDPILKRADAYYMTDGFADAGRMVARDSVRVGAQRMAQVLEGNNRSLGLADLKNLDGIRVLVHEEMHGHSRVSTKSYSGAALNLEEVGTELAARKIAQEIAGPNLKIWGENRKDLNFGAYHSEINLVVGTIQDATGKTFAESMDLVLDAHLESNVRKPGAFQSPDEVVDAFVGALKVTDAQRQAIKTEFGIVF